MGDEGVLLERALGTGLGSDGHSWLLTFNGGP